MRFLFYAEEVESESGDSPRIMSDLEKELEKIKGFDDPDAPEDADAVRVEAFIKGLKDDYFSYRFEYGKLFGGHFISLGKKNVYSSKDIKKYSRKK